MEKVLRPEHPDTGICLNNLALLYDRPGRYQEAEALYQRADAIREKAIPVGGPISTGRPRLGNDQRESPEEGYQADWCDFAR